MSINPPRATYRVQLTPQFDFAAAAAQAGYLAALGISHVYYSPYFRATPGSQHGYDVVDYHHINPDLGGQPGLDLLGEILRKHNLGQILDMVPNHMAITGRENPWWWEVLENGPSSRYATYFDVDWDPPADRHSNVVLVPVLGDHYGRVLEDLQIQVEFNGRTFTVRYYDHIFPVDPNSVSTLLATAGLHVDSAELNFLAGAFERLPLATAADRNSARRRYRDKEVLYDFTERLTSQQLEIRQAIQAAVDQINHSPDLLDVFLELQNYRLAFWRISRRELGYRRFFDINTLIGIHQDDELVYLDTHALVRSWMADQKISGLRIDHPDGMRDPGQYFQRLRKDGPDAWIVVEKILEPNEMLREDWPVQGTTGYDFLNRVNGVQIDQKAEAALTDFYTLFTGMSSEYEAQVRETKLQAATEILGSDLAHLSALFQQVCENNRRYRDYTRDELRATLSETAACLPVYRTYIRPKENQVDPSDELVINAAINRARASRPDLDPDLFAFLNEILLLHVRGVVEDELVQRFQQFTGPVMAKGVEDTLFYTYNRLVSLNEVGGDPGRFGVSIENFHHANRQILENWPGTMLSTATHDTKRGEDVRARLNVISEIPQDWEQAVYRWARFNAEYRQNSIPDRNDEYLLYQTLVGAWPVERERTQAYMLKSVREANRHTSWRTPNPDYENGLAAFIDNLYSNQAFLADLEAFVQTIQLPGRVNSLAQTLLKLTSPGVPDIYQGSELWNLSLVDPDNRRPINYAQRERLLRGLSDQTSPETVLAGMDEGLPKLWLIRQALRLRQKFPEAFGPAGSYNSIPVAKDSAVAFLRGADILVVSPRLTLRNHPEWPEITLPIPAGRWRNVLTHETMMGGDCSLAALLARFPVGLWQRESDPA